MNEKCFLNPQNQVQSETTKTFPDGFEGNISFGSCEVCLLLNSGMWI